MRARLLAAAAAVAVVGLTGCGSGDAGQAAPAPSQASPAGTPSSTAAGASTAQASAPATTVAGGSPSPAGSTGDAGSGGASGGGTSAPGTNACRSDRLRAALGPAEGAAGSVVRPLVLTNTGTAACTLRGHPGVSYVAGPSGTQVGRPALWTGPRGSVVRLAPGRSATALVSFAATGVFDPDVCRPTAVRGVRVYPPGERAALFVAAPGTGCAGRTPSPQLQVQAVTAS